MFFLWSLIIGGIIGWLAGMIIGRDIPFGIVGKCNEIATLWFIP